MSDPLAEFRGEQAIADGVKRETRRLQAALEKANMEIGELRRMAGFYHSVRHEPIKVPRWQAKGSSRVHSGLVIAQMTDWHLSEDVSADEMMGMNAYNDEIAMMRIRRWVDKVVTLPREYMAGLKIEGLVIPATGDLFTGDIHAELKESNEQKLLVAVLDWMEPIMGALQTLEAEYPAVAVHAVVGNHGRLSPKPIYKGRVHDNVEWLFWSVVRDRLKDRGSKVVVNVSPSMDLSVPIYGRNHLLTHGDQFRGGTGIAGALSPLLLGDARKRKRSTATNKSYDYLVLGHWHQSLDAMGIVCVNTLKGYDEYAANNNFAFSEPSQSFWLTDADKGRTIRAPIHVRSAAEKWEDVECQTQPGCLQT